MGQYPVFAHNGKDIGGDADCHQIEKAEYFSLVDGVLPGISLDQLEPDSASGEFFKGIGAVGTFWIEHGTGCRKFGTWLMVIGNDKIDALCIAVVDFIDRFYT